MHPDPELPELAVNFAMTWDGRISTRSGTPSDFSSPRDKRRLLEIRATGDAVLAGMNTVRVDNMQMGLPDAALRVQREAQGKPAYPLRVLVSNSGAVERGLRVFQADFSPVAIFSTQKMPQEVREALAALSGVRVHLAQADRVDLRSMLATLKREYGVNRVVCEGGPTLFRALAEEELVDELNLTLCPRVFGGVDALSITGGVREFLPTAQKFTLEHCEVVGDECFTRYRVQRG